MLDFPGAVTQGFDLADARLMIASAMVLAMNDARRLEVRQEVAKHGDLL